MKIKEMYVQKLKEINFYFFENKVNLPYLFVFKYKENILYLNKHKVFKVTNTYFILIIMSMKGRELKTYQFALLLAGVFLAGMMIQGTIQVDLFNFNTQYTEVNFCFDKSFSVTVQTNGETVEIIRTAKILSFGFFQFEIGYGFNDLLEYLRSSEECVNITNEEELYEMFPYDSLLFAEMIRGISTYIPLNDPVVTRDLKGLNREVVTNTVIIPLGFMLELYYNDDITYIDAGFESLEEFMDTMSASNGIVCYEDFQDLTLFNRGKTTVNIKSALIETNSSYGADLINTEINGIENVLSSDFGMII